MSNPLIWLSGAQPQILRRTSESARYAGIGSAVLITSTIAALSMTFALHTALKINLAGAVFCAVLWGMAIMSIDRWLVVSLQRHDRKLSYGLLVLVRLALAVLFGFIISTPVVLQIFNPEIKKEIVQIQRQSANAYYTSEKRSALAAKITTDQASVAKLRRIIDTGGGPVVNPYASKQVTTLISQRKQAQAEAGKDYRQWQCQLYDVPPGCKVGNGPLAKASHASYLTDLSQMRQDSTQIRSAVRQIKSNAAGARGKVLAVANKEMPAALAQLKSDEAEQASLTGSFKKQNANTAGLLLRLKALGDATGNNGTLKLARLLLLLFFTTIECLPVLVKSLLNLGPESNYERLLAMEDKKSLRTFEERIKLEQAAELIALEDIVDEATKLAEERRERYPRIREEILDAEDEIALRTVRGWRVREERYISEAGPLRSAWRAVMLRIAGMAATRKEREAG